MVLKSLAPNHILKSPISFISRMAGCTNIEHSSQDPFQKESDHLPSGSWCRAKADGGVSNSNRGSQTLASKATNPLECEQAVRVKSLGLGGWRNGAVTPTGRVWGVEWDESIAASWSDLWHAGAIDNALKRRIVGTNKVWVLEQACKLATGTLDGRP